MWKWENDARGTYQVGNLPRVCLYEEDTYNIFVEQEDSFWEREPCDWPDNEGRSVTECLRLAKRARAEEPSPHSVPSTVQEADGGGADMLRTVTPGSVVTVAPGGVTATAHVDQVNLR